MWKSFIRWLTGGCKHEWVLSKPMSEVRIGGRVRYMCMRCGKYRDASPAERMERLESEYMSTIRKSEQELERKQRIGRGIRHKPEFVRKIDTKTGEVTIKSRNGSVSISSNKDLHINNIDVRRTDDDTMNMLMMQQMILASDVVRHSEPVKQPIQVESDHSSHHSHSYHDHSSHSHDSGSSFDSGSCDSGSSCGGCD